MSETTTPTAGWTPGPAGTAGQAGPTAGSQQPPTQGTGGTPADGGTPSTPEDVAGLKSALAAERAAAKAADDARKAAADELQTLKDANQTESEKALGDAVKQAQADERATAQPAFRALRVEASLVGAGMKAGMARDLATSSRFATLKVNDDYSVDQAALDAAIAELKTAEPSYFTGATPTGQVTKGPQHQTAASTDVTPGPGRLRSVQRQTAKTSAG